MCDKVASSKTALIVHMVIHVIAIAVKITSSNLFGLSRYGSLPGTVKKHSPKRQNLGPILGPCEPVLHRAGEGEWPQR